MLLLLQSLIALANFDYKTKCKPISQYIDISDDGSIRMTYIEMPFITK